MSTGKLIQSLSEDPQLEKQIGCMAGIIQLFDRHQLLTGRRLYGHKRISSGARSTIPMSCESSGNEMSSVTSPYSSVEQMQHRLFLEPAIASKVAFEQKETPMSSSLENRHILRPPSRDLTGICLAETKEQMKAYANANDSTCSPYTSLESIQSLREGKSLARNSVDDCDNVRGIGRCQELLRLPTDTKDVARSSLDIRDIVRTSFDRELTKFSFDRKGRMAEIAKVSSGFSVEKHDSPIQFSERERGRSNLRKSVFNEIPRASNTYKESLRPVSTSSESMFITQTSEPPWKSVDLNESVTSLATLRASPWDFVDSKDVPMSSLDSRDGPGCCVSQDAPRFSYDGRVAARPLSFDTKDLIKSSLKTKEAPRLSLDSKLALKGTSKSFTDTLSSSQPSLSCSAASEETEHPVNGKCCPTNVVARLMGLEEMPVSSQQNRLVLKRQSPVGKFSTPTSVEDKLQLKMPSHSKQNFCTQANPVPKHLSQSTKYQEEPGFTNPRKYWEIDELSMYSENKMIQSFCPTSTEAFVPPQTNWKHQEVVPRLSKVPNSRSHSFRNQQETGASWQDEGSLPAPCASSLSPRQLFEHADRPEGTDAFCKELGKRLQEMGFPNSEQELGILKQLFDSIQFKGLLHSVYPKHVAKAHQKLESCYKQDSMLESVSKRQAIQEFKFRKVPEQLGRIPAECSSNGGQETNASMVAGQSSTKKGRSQRSNLGIQLHKENERFGNCIMNSEKEPATCNQNKESARAPSRTIKPRVNIGNVTKSKSHTLPQGKGNGFHNEAISKVSVVQGPAEKYQPCNVKSSLQKQSITLEIRKKVRTAGNVMKDKEEIRANIVMHSLKSQSTQVQMQSNGSNGSDSPSKLGNHKQNLNRLSKPETHEKGRVKKAERVSSGTKRSKIDGDTHSEGSKLLSASLKAIEKCSEIGNLKSRLVPSREAMGSEPLQPDMASLTETSINMEMLDSSWTGTDADAMRQTFVDRTKQEQPSESVNTSITVRLKNGETEQDLDWSEGLGSSFQEMEQFQNEGTGFASILPVEIPDQPSPVSVLDAAFYNDEDSPISPTKGSPPFKGSEVGSTPPVKTLQRGDYRSVTTSCGLGISKKIDESTNCLQKSLTDDADFQKSLSCQDAELKHVRKIIADVGLMEQVNSVLSRSGVPFHPEFCLLLDGESNYLGHDCQQDHYDNFELDQGCTQERGAQKLNQKLRFDVVIEILREKMHPFVIQNHPWMTSSFLPILGRQLRGEQLVKDVWKELGQLQSQPSEDICDSLFSFVESDLIQSAKQWKEHMVEIVEICLTMECLIFKDLVNETIRDLWCSHEQTHDSASQCDQSGTRRQLVYPHTK
eukprot:c26157_g1_i2 orf=210-4232(-)